MTGKRDGDSDGDDNCSVFLLLVDGLWEILTLWLTNIKQQHPLMSSRV